MTNQMGMVSSTTLMVLLTRENGLMTFKTVMELKSGMMAASTRVSSKTERRQDLECTSGVMAKSTLVNGRITK